MFVTFYEHVHFIKVIQIYYSSIWTSIRVGQRQQSNAQKAIDNINLGIHQMRF